MGTRISLGKGFTVGRSGLRYGRSIPGVPRGYASVGASGTLITGGPLRHWEPAGRRRGGSTARCGGITQQGNQCANSATLGLVCRRHADQLKEVEAIITAGPTPRPANGRTLFFFAVLAIAAVMGLSSAVDHAEQDYVCNAPSSAVLPGMVPCRP
jgi:hypothetical protein